MPPKQKKDNLDDLKQELDIDFHKITCEELYQRFQTHPENVSNNEEGEATNKKFSGVVK
jgi:hypothetical protein